MLRPFVSLLLLVAATAHAQWLDSPGRAWLAVGFSGRQHTQTGNAAFGEVNIDGVTPTVGHVSAAAFPHRFVGLDFEGRFESFLACCSDDFPIEGQGAQAGKKFLSQPSVDLSLAAVGRALPTPWLALELHAGVHFFLRSGVVRPVAGELSGRQDTFFGPTIGLGVVIAPARAFNVMLFGRVTPVSLAFSTLSARPAFSAGLQGSIGALKLGLFRFGIAPTVEFVKSAASTRDGLEVNQVGLRVALGFSIDKWIEDAVVVEPGAETLSVKGRVEALDGTKAAGVAVSLDGPMGPVATSDAQGAFAFADVKAGTHRLEPSKRV